jgi:hypothetical protein
LTHIKFHTARVHSQNMWISISQSLLRRRSLINSFSMKKHLFSLSPSPDNRLVKLITHKRERRFDYETLVSISRSFRRHPMCEIAWNAHIFTHHCALIKCQTHISNRKRACETRTSPLARLNWSSDFSVSQAGRVCKCCAYAMFSKLMAQYFGHKMRSGNLHIHTHTCVSQNYHYVSARKYFFTSALTSIIHIKQPLITHSYLFFCKQHVIKKL